MDFGWQSGIKARKSIALNKCSCYNDSRTYVCLEEEYSNGRFGQSTNIGFGREI